MTVVGVKLILISEKRIGEKTGGKNPQLLSIDVGLVCSSSFVFFLANQSSRHLSVN